MVVVEAAAAAVAVSDSVDDDDDDDVGAGASDLGERCRRRRPLRGRASGAEGARGRGDDYDGAFTGRAMATRLRDPRGVYNPD